MEANNAAAIREAAKEFVAVMLDKKTGIHNLHRLAEKCRDALSAPPRNCDVGNPWEQDERFHRFCIMHHTGSCAGCHNPVGDYTVEKGIRECALVWAQEPYKEGCDNA